MKSFNFSENDLKNNLKKLSGFSEQVKNVSTMLHKVNLANTPFEH
jgi:hypothetical protein